MTCYNRFCHSHQTVTLHWLMWERTKISYGTYAKATCQFISLDRDNIDIIFQKITIRFGFKKMQAIIFIAVTSAVLCLTSAKTPIGADDSLTYECTSTTVIITGKKATNYGSVFALGTNANNKSEVCNVSRTTQNDSAKFEINGCEVTKPISVIMMQERQNWTEHEMVIGGQSTAKYELQCNDVYLGGVTMTKTFNLSKVEDMKADTDHHQPRFTLNMTMQTADHKRLNNTVLIGTNLMLVITGTHGFRMYTQSCVARSFPNLTGHAKPLITNGVADDPMIVTNFSNQAHNTVDNETDIIEAHLYAFHFLDSDTIYVECTVTVCQNDDSSCPALSISSTKLPVHAALETSTTLALTTKTTRAVTSASTRITITGRRKRNVGNSVPNTHTVGTTLRVVDNNVVIENTSVSSSTSRVSSLWTASTFICLALQVARP